MTSPNAGPVEVLIDVDPESRATSTRVFVDGREVPIASCVVVDPRDADPVAWFDDEDRLRATCTGGFAEAVTEARDRWFGSVHLSA